MKPIRLAVAATCLTAAAALAPSPVEAFPTNCYTTFSYATNPDSMSGRCVAGSGTYRWLLRCSYFDGGPYVNRWTNLVSVASGARSSGSCTTSKPLVEIDLTILYRYN